MRETTNNRKYQTFAFIGAGNLASALIKGLLEPGTDGSKIFVRNSTDESTNRKAEQLGVSSGRSCFEIAQQAQVVVLAVKPQKMPKVLEELESLSPENKLFMSVAAGISCAQIEHAIGKRAQESEHPVRLIRAMPNTPALVKNGATGLARGSNATEDDINFCLELFDRLGLSVEVPEKEIDLITGLSGSGPAYVMRFIEAMVDAAVAHGLDAVKAKDLVIQTVHGATVLLKETKETPQELREKVTSPGGTTMAGLAALDEHNFDRVIYAAIHAAQKRSIELGQTN